MSLHDYNASKEIARLEPPFYALIMAAMRGADTRNAELLRRAFPETWDELQARYNAPGGVLLSDGRSEEMQVLQDPSASGDDSLPSPVCSCGHTTQWHSHHHGTGQAFAAATQDRGDERVAPHPVNDPCSGRSSDDLSDKGADVTVLPLPRRNAPHG